jgi:hypothetical protein
MWMTRCVARGYNPSPRERRLSMRPPLSLRLQPELDEAADGFGSIRFIGLFCCPDVHIVSEFSR